MTVHIALRMRTNYLLSNPGNKTMNFNEFHRFTTANVSKIDLCKEMLHLPYTNVK